MSLLTHMIKDIASYINSAWGLVETVFHLFSSLGAILLQLVSFVFSGLVNSVFGVVDGTVILVQDFVLFVEDVHQITDETAHAALQTFTDFTQSAFSCYSFVNTTAWAILETLFFLTESTGLGVKQLIILIGDSTLFILQLVPLTTISTVLMVSQNIIWMFQNIKLCAIIFLKGCEAFCSSFYHGLIGIPTSSLIGLLLALTMGFLLTNYLLTNLMLFNLSLRLRTAKERLTNWGLGSWGASRARKSRSNDSSFDEPQTPITKNSTKSKSALLRELEKEREDKLCVICQDRSKCFVLLPCRHLCLCQICMEILAESNSVCPICRHYVYDNLKIYN